MLRLVAAGRTSGEIATELSISAWTAEHHIQNIYSKIGVSNRAAATRWAVANWCRATAFPAAEGKAVEPVLAAVGWAWGAWRIRGNHAPRGDRLTPRRGRF